MKERVVILRSLTKGLRQLLVLSAIVLAPAGVWAQGYGMQYDIYVDGQQLNEFSSIPGVSYFQDATSNSGTLTLTDANINTIESGLNDLYIDLVGNSTINGNVNNESAAPISTTGDGTLTFSGSGTLTFSGTRTHQFTGFTIVSFNNLGYYASTKEIKAADTYQLWVGGMQVTSANAAGITGDRIMDGNISYNAQANMLTLDNAEIYSGNRYSVVLGSNMSALDVMLVGDNNLIGNGFEFVENPATLTFKTDETKPGSLALPQGGFIFASIDDAEDPDAAPTIICENGLEYDVEAKKVSKSESQEDYYLKIGNHTVTGSNRDVLGDGTVSFDADIMTLTLNDATIGGATAQTNILISSPLLTIKIIGTNTLDGGLQYMGSGKCDVAFITDAATASLTMNDESSYGNQFNFVYRNRLSASSDAGKMTVSLPTNYGISIAGTPITPGNRMDVLNDGGTVRFDTNAQLVLYGANINGEIEVTADAQLSEDGLKVFLVNNTTITNTTGKAINYTGSGTLKLTIDSDAAETGQLTYTNPNAVPTEASVFSNCTVTYSQFLALSITDNSLKVVPALVPVVNLPQDMKEAIYSKIMDETTNTNNNIIDGFLYTMGDESEGSDVGGYDQTTGMMTFTLNSIVDEDEIDKIMNKPGTKEYAKEFTGITALLPAGESLVKFKDLDFEAMNAVGFFDYLVKIGYQDAMKLKQSITQSAGSAKTTVEVPVVTSSPTLLRFFMAESDGGQGVIDIQSAPRQDSPNHRIGPKSSVAGGLGGISVQSNTIQTASQPAETYKTMELAAMKAAMSAVTDPRNGYTCNDPDITDLPNDMFVSNTSAPALRRTAGTILPEGLTFIDFSNTKITGMEVSRTSGPFKGVPENVFIYMPAGNTTKEKNVVIGDICDVVELDGSDDAQPFKAMKNFKAGQVTLNRTFEAGSAASKATVYLPYAISQEGADKLGKFYKYAGMTGTTVNMTQVTSGGLKANMPYIFEAKEGGVTSTRVRTTEVIANPVETDGFKGVYERKDYESGMYCYVGKADGSHTVGQFVEMGTGSYVPPFRAYMIGNGAPSYAIAWDGVIDDSQNDENATTIETVKTLADKKIQEGWWTLNGMRLNAQPKKAGLYIKDGRLVVVK